MERDSAWTFLSKALNKDTRMMSNLPVSKAFAAHVDTTPHAAEEMWRRLSAKQKHDWIERDKEKSDKKREHRRRPERRPREEVVAKAAPEEELKKQNNRAVVDQQYKIKYPSKRTVFERATSCQNKIVECAESSLYASSGDTRKVLLPNPGFSPSFFKPSRARQEQLKEFASMPKSLSVKNSFAAMSDELTALKIASDEPNDSKSRAAQKPVDVADVQRSQNRSPPGFLSSLVVVRKDQDKAVKSGKSELLQQPSTVDPCVAVVPVVRSEVVQHPQPSTAVLPSVRNKPKTLPPSVLLRQRKLQPKGISPMPMPIQKVELPIQVSPKYKTKTVSISKFKSTFAEPAVHV